jgi:hypothetical protein
MIGIIDIDSEFQIEMFPVMKANAKRLSLRKSFPSAGAAALFLLTFVSTSLGDERLEFFEKRIRPVLAAHCFECHGPEKAESDLRLDHIFYLKREASEGVVLVSGEPNTSRLYLSLTHRDQDLTMPLDRDKLADDVIADFRQWIQDGAVWPEEPLPDGADEEFDLARRKQRLPWIWETPTRQAIPTPKNGDWARSDIDRFVLGKLETANMVPAAEAAPEVWLRRVYFAITGLPPTPEQIHEFLPDPTDEQREAIVDRLLDSPHFGERWARHWMDLVRYAESRGHESDFAIANAWHYRDYLIRALNDDLSYDQFVIEHIAGDLLETPRINKLRGFNESILATAWPFFGEEVHSPVDIRQDECDRLDNKIDVFSKTFLGLTVACARCHDHKFDAISQQDYYALSGFLLSSHFRQARFETIDQNGEIAKQLESLYGETQLELGQQMAAAFRDKIKSATERLSTEAALSIEVPAESSSNSKVIVDYSDPNHTWYSAGYAFGSRARRVGDFVIPDDASVAITEVELAGVARRDPIWNVLKLRPGNEGDSGSLNAVGRSAGLLSTPTFVLDDGKVHLLLQGETQVYAAVDSHLMIIGPLHKRLVTALKAPKRKWLTIDLSEYRGHRVHLEFGPVGDAPLSIWSVVEGAIPIMETQSPGSEQVTRVLEQTIDALAARSEMTRQHAAVTRWLLQNSELLGASPTWHQRQKQIIENFHDRRKELAAQIETTSHTAIAMMDGTGVDERVLKRGKHQSPGQIAPRNLPAAFELSPKDGVSGSGRLRLAKRLADPKNPLVARVIVNRIWHHLFGRGIVDSVDNFGWLGGRPTHPELLDQLAYQFVHDDDWSIKQTIKRIVLTRTYSMSSRPDDSQAEQLDPKNLLIHRMPVRRLEAEVIRDNLLAVSGRLDPTLHGEPVPVHLTEFVVGRGRPEVSGPLDGNGRRSIYTSVRRNFLPTMMLTFDSPIPFSTVGRRNVTNVPAQTLALMNDKLIYEQAATWAKRIQIELPDADAGRRIKRIYWQAFARAATTEEISTTLDMLKLLALHHDLAQSDVKVWTDLCHTMFRVNEFIYLR